MIGFNEVMDRMTQIWVPGVSKFYEKFEVDPWQKADDDLSEVLVCQDKTAIEHALVGYEAKKKRLIALYKQFIDLQDLKPKSNTFENAFITESVYLTRNNICCDECHRSVVESKSLTLQVHVEKDSWDELVKKIRAVCSACASRKAH